MKSRIVFALSVLALSSTTEAGLTIDPGWDLFVTVPTETRFNGQNWEGVPLGTYDFGGTIGIKPTGPADTIMHRPDRAEVADYGQADTIPIELVALHLRSVAPFDPDGPGPAPLDTYYLTLNGPSGGTATIFFDHEPGIPPHGWFSSAFNVNWGMHLGGFEGPVIATGTEGPFELDRGYWNHTKTPPTGGVPLIPGVNYLLNGVDTSMDFHLAYDPNGGPVNPYCPSPWYQHVVRLGLDPAKHAVTECPEPASIGLILFGAATMKIRRR